MKILLLITVSVVAASLGEDSPALKEYNDGVARFTSDVYTELVKSKSGNFLVCPISVNIVLALAHAGAGGITAHELASGLHLPNSNEKIHQAIAALTPTLNVNDKYTLNSANKMYIKDGFQISDQFKTTAVNVFNAEVESIDFLKKAQAATQMNRWIEEKTHNKIKDIIDKDALDEDTRALLINAIYFHGTWVTKFNAEATRKRPFHLDSKKQVEVDMMEVTSRFNYYESSELNAQFLEMLYQGGDVTMTIVLPANKEGLSALESKIVDVLAVPQYRREKVHVQIPKFKIETTIDFNDILKKLGIVNAFEDSANFSGIGAHSELLKISKVLQKAFIDVDEKGTTAAAATVVQIQNVRSGHIIEIPKEFIADHPFIYFLKTKGTVLFIGHYAGK